MNTTLTRIADRIDRGITDHTDADALRALDSLGECDECDTPYSFDPTDGGSVCVRCMKEKLTALQQAAPAQPVAQPLFYVRLFPNGLYEGPHHARSQDGKELREAKPGEWVGLYTAAQQAAPTDPMDWPLPCDVKVGHGTMRKGVRLGTLVARMKVLYEMATGENADKVAGRTMQEREALGALMFNGLTEAETAATALVAGLTQQAAPAQPALEKIMDLADDYARAAKRAHVESLYGTSKSYTAECQRAENGLRSELFAALAARHVSLIGEGDMAPAQARQPLTAERIAGIFYPMGTASAAKLQVAMACARAIELAHGIGDAA